MAAAQEQKSKKGEKRRNKAGREHNKDHAHGRRKMGQDIMLHHERRRA
jgi:hypothetical protein